MFNCKTPTFVTANLNRKSSQSQERATSQTRLLGFEPVGEIVEDTLNNNFHSQPHLKTQQTIERRGRSQAVKKVSKQGVNQSSEEVFLLTSEMNGKGNSAIESIEVGNLCQADTSKLTVIMDEEHAIDVPSKVENVPVKQDSKVLPPQKKVKKNYELTVKQHNEENTNVSTLDYIDQKEHESGLPHYEPKVEDSIQEEISKQNNLTDKSEEASLRKKLKKTELNLKKMAETKVEIPILKHHEFESEAQCIDTEEETDINLQRMILDMEDMSEESESITSESLFQEKEEDTDEETHRLEPGIQDLKFSQKLKADKITIQNSEDKTKQVASEVEPVNTVLKKPLEHENQDFELTVKKKQTREDKNFNSEEFTAQTIKMPHSQSKLDKECTLEETNETVLIDQPKIDDIPLKKKNQSNKKDTPKSEEPLFKQGLKLRKTETVKRPIEKAAIEVPKLKHHAFENIPQDVIEEQHSDIKLSRLLPQLTKKKKKKQSPKEMEEEPLQEMPFIEVPEENKFPEEMEEETPQEMLPTIESEDKIEAEELSAKTSTKDTVNETELISDQKDEPRLPPSKPVKRKQKENRPETSEPLFTQGLKLKKTEVVKKPLEKSVIDIPKLKHHEFESVPQEMEAEQVSNVKLSTSLPQPKGKEKKTKPKRQNDQSTKKDQEETSNNLKIVNTPTEMEFTPNEETTLRKERDEITAHSAAISKKHSDLEKVELPAYLNFPSDQGISISEGLTEDTKILSRSPTGIIESVQENAEPKAPVVEKQVLTRAGKQVKKVPKKSDETYREIPIIVEGTKTTESMTNETVIESEVSCPLFFHPSSYVESLCSQ